MVFLWIFCCCSSNVSVFLEEKVQSDSLFSIPALCFCGIITGFVYITKMSSVILTVTYS